VAGPGLSARSQPADQDAARVLGAYQAALAAGLAGSRRARTAILVEIADGLLEATQAHQDRGLTARAAAEAAVAEFGDPGELARLLVAEQAGAAAHRVGLGLVSTGPVVGGVWLAAWASRTGLGWLDQIGALLSQFPVFVVVLGLGVPAAVLATIAGAGPLACRLAVPPRRAAALAVLAACAAAVADGTLLTGIAVTGGAVTGGAATGWSWPLIAAAAVSLSRLTAAGTAAHRCARLRAAS
jgi:hypothetical protein